MKTELDFVGCHCEACGEGSLQLMHKAQNITHKGINLVIDIKIPRCTICGASLLPKYLRKEIKDKAKAMYKSIMENNQIDESLNYNITVKSLVHNSFEEKVSHIVPTDTIKGFDGKRLNITYNDLIKSFNKVFLLLDAPNFVISKRRLVASYVIDDLKIKNEIDSSLLYEQVNGFFQSENASHVDYMAINPVTEKKNKKNKKIIYRVFRNNDELNRYISYDCLLFNSTLENILSQYTPLLNMVEMPHAIYYYVTADEITNNKKPIGIIIDEIHLLGVKWDELDTDYLLTRVNTESNVLYVHI